jgi:hypothetical protein
MVEKYSPSGAVNRVVIHIPFLTSVGLEIGVPPTAEWTALLLERVSGGESGWSVPAINGSFEEQLHGEAQLQRYSGPLTAELGGYLPHRLVQRHLGSALHVADEGGLGQGTDTSWRSALVVAGIWNVGVGLLTTVYKVTVSPHLTWEEYGAVAYEACRLVGGLRKEFVLETARSLREGIEDSPELEAVTVRRNLPEDAELLWTHVLFLSEFPQEIAIEVKQAAAATLVKSGGDYSLSTGSSHIALRLGLSSCAAYPPDDSSASATVSRLIGIHNISWAAAVDFDRLLFRQLAGASRRERQQLDELEREAEDLLSLYERVRQFRSAVDVSAVHLDKPDAEIWKAIDQEWHQSAQLKALDDKLEALDHVFRHLTTALDARRSRRLNDIALLFTIATIVTLGLESLTFLGVVPLGVWWLKGLIVFGLLSFALILWLFVRRRVAGSGYREPRPRTKGSPREL